MRILSRLSLALVAAVLLVVAVPAEAQRSNEAQRTLTAANPCIPLDVQGLGTATVDVSGSWTGTLTIYRQGRNGTRDSGETTTSNGLTEVVVAGYHTLVVCFTTPTSGTPLVGLLAAGTGGGGGSEITGEIMVEIEGFSTEAKQDSAIALLTTIDADTSAAATDLAAIETLLTTIDTVLDGILADTAGTLTVAGTVTANLSATDNGVLDNIDADLTTIIDDVDGIEALLTTIDADTSAMVVDLAAIEVLLGTIDADTGSILTAAQLLDNIVSVEDAVAGSGWSGVGMLAVRQDSHSDLAADGDFIPLTIDQDGGLRVSIVAGAGSGGTACTDDCDFTAGTTSFTPVGGFYQSSVTACTDGDACTIGVTAQRTAKVTLFAADGSELTPSEDQTEDAASAGGETGPMVLTVRRDSAASSAGTDGDFATLNTDASGRLWVNCGTGCSGGTQFAEDAASQNGDVGTIALAIRDDTLDARSGTEGDFEYLHTNANGALWVIDVNSAAALTALQLLDNVVGVEDAGETGGGGLAMAGTVRRDTAASSAGTTGDNATLNTDATGHLYTRDGTLLANMVAHDAADAGNPLKFGAKATTSVSGVTEVAANDRTDLYAGIDGVLITRPHSNLEDRVSGVVGVTDGSSTSLIASQGAGLRFCATTLIVSNSSATNVTVDIRDGTGGSVIATIPAAANMGGAVIPLSTPLCTSDATAMAVDPSAAATTVTVTAIGFKTDL